MVMRCRELIFFLNLQYNLLILAVSLAGRCDKMLVSGIMVIHQEILDIKNLLT